MDNSLYCEKTEGANAQIISFWTEENSCTLENSAHTILSGSFSYNNAFFAANVYVESRSPTQGYNSDHEFWLWSTQNGKLLKKIDSYTNGGGTISFSEDGKILVATEKYSSGVVKIRIWSAVDGRLLRNFNELGSYPNPIVTPDGKLIAISNAKEIFLWSIETGEKLYAKESASSTVTALAFSPDGKIIAHGQYDKSITLSMVETGEVLKIINPVLDENRYFHDSKFTLNFSPDGKILASGDEQGVIKLWSVETGKLIEQIKAHRYHLRSLSFSVDGNALFSCDGYTIKKWKMVVKEYPGSDNTTEDEDILASDWQSVIDNSIHTITEIHPWFLQFSPDGKYLAMWGEGSAISIFSATTGKYVRSIYAYRDNVKSITFNSSGSILATTGSENNIVLWSIETGDEIRRFDDDWGQNHAIDFSPDDKSIAIATHYGRVRVISALTGKNLKKAKMQNYSPNLVKYSPDGNLLAYFSYKSLVLASSKTGKQIRIFDGMRVNTQAFDFSRNSKNVIFLKPQGNIDFYSIETGELLKSLELPDPGLDKLVLSPDEESILVYGNVPEFYLISSSTGEIQQTYEGHSDRISSVDISPDGKLLASTSVDKTIKFWLVDPADKPSYIDFEQDSEIVDFDSIQNTNDFNGWDFETGNYLRSIDRVLNSSYGLRYSPNGEYVAVQSSTYNIDLLSSKSWDIVRKIDVPMESFRIFEFSNDCKRLYASDWKGNIIIFSVDTGEMLRKNRFEFNTEMHPTVTVSPDWKYIVANVNGTLEVWSLEDKEFIRSFKVDDKNAPVIAISPDGKYIVTSRNRLNTKLLLDENGVFLGNIIQKPSDLNFGCFSPDSSMIALKGNHRTVLWSTKTRKVINEFESPGHYSTMKFSPDGKLLASTVDDFKIHVYSTETGDLINDFWGHVKYIHSMDFSPDGKILSSTSDDDTIKLWGVDNY